MTLETVGEILTIDRVNDVLDRNWVAVHNPTGLYNGSLAPHGFELYQGQRTEDGDFEVTTDSIPVISARNVGNSVQFALLGGGKLELHQLETNPL